MRISKMRQGRGENRDKSAIFNERKEQGRKKEDRERKIKNGNDGPEE